MNEPDEPRLDRIRLKDQWHRRDLPILVAVAEKVEAGEQGIRARYLYTEMDRTFAEVSTALEALSVKYIEAVQEGQFEGRLDWRVLGLTEAGRREVGLWPSGEGVDALLEALRQAEQTTDDPEQQGHISQRG